MNNIGNDGQCILSDMTKVNSSEEEVKDYKLFDGDFLFNTRNSYELVGKTCVYRNEKDEIVLFNNNIYRMNFLGNLNKDFINIFFNSVVGKEGLDKLKSSTTNVAAIYQGKLMGLLISIPPFNEQERIVEKVNELMSLCNALEEKLKKKAIVAERLTGAVVQKISSKK